MFNSSNIVKFKVGDKVRFKAVDEVKGTLFLESQMRFINIYGKQGFRVIAVDGPFVTVQLKQGGAIMHTFRLKPALAWEVGYDRK